MYSARFFPLRRSHDCRILVCVGTGWPVQTVLEEREGSLPLFSAFEPMCEPCINAIQTSCATVRKACGRNEVVTFC